jgi:rhodanese-related sulfurtransferase
VLLAVLVSTGSQAQEKTLLSPADFEQGIAGKNTQVLDVRTAEEFRQGHIAHALQANWNNQDEFQQRVAHIDKSAPLYVYCAAGGRSKAAAQWLRSNGFTTVYELNGGFVKWKWDNKPVEGMPAVKTMAWSEYQAALWQEGVTLVDVGAEWCPPCRKMEPVLQQLRTDLPGRFKLLKIDAGVQTELLKQLQATEYPTFIVYRNGKEVWRKQGVVSLDELKQVVK